MPKVIETFDAIAIKNTSLQIHNNNGTKENGEKIGCVGSISGETTMRELVKRCEGVEVRKRAKPERMDLTLTAHVKLALAREIFGLTNEDLKPGVYKYSKDAKGKEFTLTADVVDEFEDETKLIAFPKCTSATGLKFTVANGAEEVAELELLFSVYPDEEGNFYYEAVISELEDAEMADEWHVDFQHELVAVPVPNP